MAAITTAAATIWLLFTRAIFVIPYIRAEIFYKSRYKIRPCTLTSAQIKRRLTLQSAANKQNILSFFSSSAEILSAITVIFCKNKGLNRLHIGKMYSYASTQARPQNTDAPQSESSK
jgi:hypothetical protein